jgi:hypothetical protein
MDKRARIDEMGSKCMWEMRQLVFVFLFWQQQPKKFELGTGENEVMRLTCGALVKFPEWRGWDESVECMNGFLFCIIEMV